MKKISTSLLVILFSLWTIDGSAQIFVDDGAEGNNDGTSWTDAFPDLLDALAAATDGDQIWVAEGTYLPGSTPTSTFLIDKNILLYGGFAGGEMDLSERGDPADHPSVLSGDLSGDDVDDDFDNFKSDNVMTVVTVAPNISNAVLLDGFTISNGQADGTISNQELRGGGLYTGGSVIVQHCLFTQNFAGVTGGGAHLYAGSLTDGVSVEVNSCRFEKNRSGQEGGGMYLDAWGQNSTFTVIDCEFNENVAQSFGGGVSALITQTAGNNNIVVEDCSFTKNSAVEISGGGMVCSPGGGNTNIVLKNSTFTENESAGFGAVGIWGWGPAAYGTVDISDCLFENNTATYSAGLSWGSLPNVNDFFTWNLTNCEFIGNHATDSGGAMDFYGEAPSGMTVEGCNFIGNSAGLEGGAILAVTNHPEFVGRISNCVFENNSSPAGAAIVANDFTEEPGMTQDADITFENCLMTGNTGDAGTFNLYNIGTVKLLNCTIADNPAGGIVQNENSTLALQNTILANPEGFIEYIGATGNTDMNSLGGNLVLDNSLNDLLGEFDKPESDPGFMPDSFEPSSSSALINAGVNDGVTSMFDLAGNDRIQEGTVDIGAYESPFVTSAREVIAGEITLSPNPTTNFLFVDFPENFTQSVKVSLFDPAGKLMKREMIVAGQRIDLEDLATGMYFVKAVVDERVYTGKFIKF